MRKVELGFYPEPENVVGENGDLKENLSGPSSMRSCMCSRPVIKIDGFLNVETLVFVLDHFLENEVPTSSILHSLQHAIIEAPQAASVGWDVQKLEKETQEAEVRSDLEKTGLRETQSLYFGQRYEFLKIRAARAHKMWERQDRQLAHRQMREQRRRQKAAQSEAASKETLEKFHVNG